MIFKNVVTEPKFIPQMTGKLLTRALKSPPRLTGCWFEKAR